MDYQLVKSHVRSGRLIPEYIRKTPFTVDYPTPKQAAQRLKLSELSHDMCGARGAVVYDYRRIPANSFLIAPLLRGSPALDSDTLPAISFDKIVSSHPEQRIHQAPDLRPLFPVDKTCTEPDRPDLSGSEHLNLPKIEPPPVPAINDTRVQRSTSAPEYAWSGANVLALTAIGTALLTGGLLYGSQSPHHLNDIQKIIHTLNRILKATASK